MIGKTAECVSPKHPDKICDRISDAILDECLKQDPMSRVAVETFGGHGTLMIGGEITTKANVDYGKVARRVLGEKPGETGMGILVNIVYQSPDIAKGLEKEDGAGDQGICVGYACDDNEAMIPRELNFARLLCKYLFEKFPYDGKTQITLDEEGKIKTIVASFQNVETEVLKASVSKWIIECLLVSDVREDTEIKANSAGDWSIGGFDADTGLTGRKIIVDAYGPQVAVGGGAFSGKDATKVDRSGAYMARKIAVDLLKRLKAKEVIVKLAYAIGVAKPVMFSACIDGVEADMIEDGWKFTTSDYDLTPKAMIEKLDLRSPQFEKTAEWGHFGNGFLWDKPASIDN